MTTTSLLQRVSPVLACAAALAFGCGAPGDSQGESSEEVAQAPGHSSEEQLHAFSSALTHYAHSDYSTPKDVKGMLSNLGTVAVGTLVSVEPGRKEFQGFGCEDLEEDESDPGCKGDPNAVIYDSYVNLNVEVDRVMKGRGPARGEVISIELPWPNNVDVAEAAGPAPIGQTVLVMGDEVTGAQAKAEPLEEHGIFNADDVAENLVQVPAYGLVLKDTRGRGFGVLMPHEDIKDIVKEGGANLRSFDALVAAVGRAAEAR